MGGPTEVDELGPCTSCSSEETLRLTQANAEYLGTSDCRLLVSTRCLVRNIFSGGFHKILRGL